jgi:DNA recombination protein RmuC
MTLEIYAALALLVLIAVLLIVLLLRRPRVELPPEWPQRLQALEAAVQATQLAVAKNDGALDGMGQQLRGFTQATQATLDAPGAVRAGVAHQPGRAAGGVLGPAGAAGAAPGAGARGRGRGAARAV